MITKHNFVIIDKDGNFRNVPMKITTSILEELKRGWINETKLPAILYTPNELAIFTLPESEYMAQLMEQVTSEYEVMIQEIWTHKEMGHWMNRIIIGKR